MHELERLYKLSGTGLAATRKRNKPESGRPPALPGDSGPEGRWEVSIHHLLLFISFRN